jgi:antitoxin component YwqK of YwqJK toxin-antitoxin module
MFAKLQKEPDLNCAIQKLVQDECNILLNQIPTDNIITHLLNNRSEEIFIPQYYTTEHIIQRAKSRLDKDITKQEATDILKDLSNHDDLFNIDNAVDDKCEKIIEEKEAGERRIIEAEEKRIEKEIEFKKQATKRREEDYAELKEKTPSHLELVINYWDIDDTTTKKKIYFLNKDGELEGLYQEFYTNGNLWRESTYKEGKREGLEKVFYANGGLHISRMYQNDKLHGEIKEFNTVGNIVYEAIFKNGIMQ